MMGRLERFHTETNTFFYYIDSPKVYWYDKDNSVHYLIHECKDYGGLKYIAEWKIPGTSESGIVYAKRMAQKLLPNTIELAKEQTK